MKRRAFIKGMIATGILTLTPLEPICAGFRPRSYQMAHAQEFVRGMAEAFGKRAMYGRSYGGDTMAAAHVLTGLMQTPDVKWFSLTVKDEGLQSDPKVREWLEQVEDAIMDKMRRDV